MATTTSNTSVSTLYGKPIHNGVEYSPVTRKYTIGTGPSITYFNSPTTLNGPTVDYEKKYWIEIGELNAQLHDKNKIIAGLQNEVDALKKALEGFVGVTI